MQANTKQIILVIFDGWGYSKSKKYNAIAEANPQFFNHLWETYPHALLKASGEAIGLPEGQIGTSEIAHTTIGAGKVIHTDLVRVNKAIKEGTLCANEVLQKVFDNVKKNNSTLHFLGQVSPGGVHSHQDHLFAMLRCAKDAGIKKIAIHAFTDGRDEPPMSADIFLQQLENVLQKLGVGRIASITGRYYAMDRDTNWERTKRAEEAIFKGIGKQFPGKTAVEIAKELHKEKIGDEFFKPCILPDETGKPITIQSHDSVFFFNFRPDRARQLSYLIEKEVTKMHLCFATLSQYDPHLQALVTFPKIKIETTLAGEISQARLTQVHIAETEKFAHLTYFFDGERDKPYPYETYDLIPSRKVATHDLAPQMRAKEITDHAIEHIEKGTNFVALNFANADMVGHTGKMAATVEAIKVVDHELQRVVEAILKKDGVAFITADHGNAELMFDEKNNQPMTAHTLNPVPAILTEHTVKLRNGSLEDVAPTILELFDLPKPREMTGKSLIEE